MPSIRHPCVAGYFYPADPLVLEHNIKQLLASAKDQNLAAPKAIIAPHAGYIYSGAVAATVYKTLIPNRDLIRRVVLLGPAHRLAFMGIATSKVTNFSTPMGAIAVDLLAVDTALQLPGVQIIEQAYNMEHCLEVQLPFLQSVLSNFQIVPFIVGNATPQLVADLIEKLWGGPETLIVISSDLSHYYDQITAQKLDQDAGKAIIELCAENINSNQACGRIPIQGLLIAAAKLKMHAKLLDLRNSGDTAGNKDKVVGYGAFHFS